MLSFAASEAAVEWDRPPTQGGKPGAPSLFTPRAYPGGTLYHQKGGLLSLLLASNLFAEFELGFGAGQRSLEPTPLLPFCASAPTASRRRRSLGVTSLMTSRCAVKGISKLDSTMGRLALVALLLSKSREGNREPPQRLQVRA